MAVALRARCELAHFEMDFATIAAGVSRLAHCGKPENRERGISSENSSEGRVPGANIPPTQQPRGNYYPLKAMKEGRLLDLLFDEP
jgi:hypothetical protein